MRVLGNLLAATALLGLSLLAWRFGFRHSDWASIALVPMFLVLFVGTWSLSLSAWKAEAGIVLQPESILSLYLTGRIGATLRSVSFSTVSVTFLAWIGLGKSTTATSAILLAYVVSAATYALAQQLLRKHLRTPFSDIVAASLATWWVALPFIPLVGWLTWATVPIDGSLRGADIRTVLDLALDQLPARQSFLSGIMSVPFAYEAFKLWIVVQFPGLPIIGLFYCLDSALATLVACRAGAVTAHFLQVHVLSYNDTRT